MKITQTKSSWQIKTLTVIMAVVMMLGVLLPAMSVRIHAEGWSSDGDDPIILPPDPFGDYAVYYDANGGSGAVPLDPSFYDTNNEVTVLFDAIPSRSGYTFLGWATSASATTPQFTPSGTKTFTMGSSSVTLYAVWEKVATVRPELKHVLYDANGGEGDVPIDMTTYEPGDTVNVKFDCIPSRSGYTFLGWASSASATTPQFTKGGVDTFPMIFWGVTLYAVWQKDTDIVLPDDIFGTFSVHYDANGGIGNVPIDERKYAYGDTVEVRFDCNPSCSYTELFGWATCDGATVPEFTEDGRTSFTMNRYSDVTLYAVWKTGLVFAAVMCNLEYDANGGSFDGTAPTVSGTAGDAILVQFEDIPTRKGYHFLGWAEDPAATEPKYTEDGLNSLLINEADTLYAVWEPDAIAHASLVTDGATTVCSGPGQYITMTVVLSGADPVKSMLIDPIYDDSILEMVEGNWSYAVRNHAMLAIGGHSAVIALLTPTDINGDVFEIVFKVKDDVAVSAVTDVSVLVVAKGMEDGEEYKIPTTVDSVSLTVGHDYLGSWFSDATAHWYACTMCGKAEGRQVHAYDNSCDAYCNICGHARTAAHVWDDGVLTGTGSVEGTGMKTFTCTKCGATKEETVPVYMFSVSDAETYAGDTFTVDITVNNSSVKSLMIQTITYDKTVMTLKSVSWGSAVSSSLIKDWNGSEAVLAFTNNADVNGVVLTLTFEVTDDAEADDYEIGCQVLCKRMDGTNEVQVDTSVSAGTVHIARYIRGDVNGDGQVNSDDAIHLLKHTLMPGVYLINQSGDMDGNGFVDSNDAIYLLKYTLRPEKYPLS